MVERVLYTHVVGGSIPSPPTIQPALWLRAAACAILLAGAPALALDPARTVDQ